MLILTACGNGLQSLAMTCKALGHTWVCFLRPKCHSLLSKVNKHSRKGNRNDTFLHVLTGGSAGKESACSAGDLGSIPELGRFPWRREQLPTPSFWPGEFHGLFHGVTKSWTRLSDLHFTIKGYPGNPVRGKRIGKDDLY